MIPGGQGGVQHTTSRSLRPCSTRCSMRAMERADLGKTAAAATSLGSLQVQLAEGRSR
ncbi:MAG: hypothetical protein ABI746_09415 [Dermatophilaceae bacterium]